MEVVASTPPKSPAKRARTTPTAKAAPAPVAKQKAAPRRSKMPKARLPAPELLAAMISTAAYYRAASRGFAPGQELQDWLEAERLILAQYT